MANANTSSNFQNALAQYPCIDFNDCHAIGGLCQHRNYISSCPTRTYISTHTVKMRDSGIFSRSGVPLTYEQLVTIYDRMGIEYGIMIDVLQYSEATLASVRQAAIAYEAYKNKFKLVGVAQGKTEEEYLNCYAKLKEQGFQYIAVGVILRRIVNTVRYFSFRDETFLFQILEKLCQEYPDDWLFALGGLSATRLQHLKKLNVWADYKGCIFQYKKRNQTLNDSLKIIDHRQL
jgi:hypothetical protein